MVLSSIYLKNFRIHQDTQLSFSGQLNYIIGGNGQGKTSILEAIYYLCTTKSSIAKFDNEAVKFRENEFEIIGKFRELTENTTRLFYSLKENKKYCFQNGKQISRSADIIGKFPIVLLAPADHSITQGSPIERRKFIDSVISQASETYLNLLLDYNKTLRHRASLLYRIKEERTKILFDELDAWTLKLINSGSEIIRHRLKFIDEFNIYMHDSYEKIMENIELPEVKYSYLDECVEEKIEVLFKKQIDAKKTDELRRAANLCGPHRDDFVFLINGINLKIFGSQGQHKTFQTALRFAQFFYLKERTGKTPIFLLDDVFGELDKERSQKISEYLKSVGQVFITLTDITNFSFLNREENDSLIYINGGKVAYA
ncbi:MAG: DNA replication and repair protein RecF [Ignavibacteriaceae bacterium]